MRDSGFDGDVLPVLAGAFGVLAEGAFVFNQDDANDAGVVREAEVGNGIRNDIEFALGVADGEESPGDGGVGDILGFVLGEILEEVGQELELFDEMRELGRVDLREGDFDGRELFVNLLQVARRHFGRAVPDEISQFSHGWTVGMAEEMARRIEGEQGREPGVRERGGDWF